MKSSFPQRRPILFVVLLLLLFLITFFLAGAITLQLKLSSLTMTLMADGVLALIALFLLSRLHSWREAGFRLPAKPHYLWLFAVPCLPIILNMAYFGVSYPGIGRLLLFLAIALLVGFVEESYFRGMILRALLRRGPWQAVIISSLFFGILHLLNLAGGANLAATLLQVVYAVAIGLMYAALALRTQTILPLIVTHGLTDFVGFLALNSTVVTTGLSRHGRRDHRLHCVQYYPDAPGEAADTRDGYGGKVQTHPCNRVSGLRSAGHGMGSIFPNAAVCSHGRVALC